MWRMRSFLRNFRKLKLLLSLRPIGKGDQDLEKRLDQEELT
jgi:hypothetical protein